MAPRTILTDRQRAALSGLPADEATHLRFHVLSDQDTALIRRRRRPRNRLGFALQLCAFRYPGRLIQPGEVIPEPMLGFIGAQLGLTAEELAAYGTRRETRYEHSAALQDLYGYRPFEGRARVARCCSGSPRRRRRRPTTPGWRPGSWARCGRGGSSSP